MSPFALYIHIPYCTHKCPYCDFNTYAVATIPEKEYVAALLSEIDYRSSSAAWFGRAVKSIYFGGGTPSLFKVDSIAKIISGVVGSFPVDERIEISLEANPGALPAEDLKLFRDAGVNRLSLGSQSLNPKILKTLGRQHSPADIEAAVNNARGAGFTNINLDLIYGVPEQTLTELKQDLSAVVALSPQHISAYGLTIEKGTPFFNSYKKGILKPIDEDLALEFMQEIGGFLPLCGYKHYEISNFAIPGFEARHNLAYWNGDDYLGLGAGAHSYLSANNDPQIQYGLRWSNYALPQQYISETIAKGYAQSWQDTLAIESAMFEYFFLGLRKRAGVTRAGFMNKFKISVEQAYGARIQILIEQGMLECDGDFIRLSDKGVYLADSVMEEFTTPECRTNDDKIAAG
jgi:oxygen-independent coproporphyrinogen-3 oxidase